MAGLIIISHRLDPSVVPKYSVPPLRGTGTGVKPVIKPEASPVTNSDNHTGTGGGSCGKYGSKPPPPVILP
jgi:hypothetical protein